LKPKLIRLKAEILPKLTGVLKFEYSMTGELATGHLWLTGIAFAPVSGGRTRTPPEEPI
jgi:hypothetical protein